MRFKPGQEVVCVSSGDWTHTPTGTPFVGPKKDELVVVNSYCMCGNHISLAQYLIVGPDGEIPYYVESAFEPVVSIDELKEVLETVPEEQLV